MYEDVINNRNNKKITMNCYFSPEMKNVNL